MLFLPLPSKTKHLSSLSENQKKPHQQLLGRLKHPYLKSKLDAV